MSDGRTRRQKPMATGRTRQRNPFRAKSMKAVVPKAKAKKEELFVVLPDTPKLPTTKATIPERERKVKVEKPPVPATSMFYGRAVLATPRISIHNYNPSWNV